jgi:wobble nucleotide-excising tRNase
LIITEDNNEMTEIHQWIAVANRAYFALKDVMKSANVHRKTKVSSELYYVMAVRRGP